MANANLAEEEEALGKVDNQHKNIQLYELMLKKIFFQSRDDELATSWDTKLQEWVDLVINNWVLLQTSMITTSLYRRDRLSTSADEDIVAIAKVVELSLSESQPFNRYAIKKKENENSFVIKNFYGNEQLK